MLFDREIAAGLVDEADTRLPQAADLLRVRAVPPRQVRRLQQALLKLRLIDWQRSLERPALAARRHVLRDAACAPPRFLIRVDEFPNYRAWEADGEYGVQEYLRFHRHMAGVPYLLAVLPRVSRHPLDPTGIESRPLEAAEISVLREVADDRVCFAAHGRDHRTRFASPRRHSELCGLSAAATCELVDESLAELKRASIEPKVFVAPYNRFDASQLPLLHERFEVVCGGPESVGTLGLQTTPQWRASGVYLPSYPPFYGSASEIIPAVEGAIERQVGLWLPVTLHWEWEARDGCRSLGRLVDLIAPHTATWQELLEAMQRSASPPAATSRDAGATSHDAGNASPDVAGAKPPPHGPAGAGR